MKKLMMMLFLAIALILTGCGTAATNGENNGSKDQGSPSNGEEGNSDETNQDEQNQETTEGFVFEIDGVSIAMHDEAAPILEALGNPQTYFESEACAFPGLEKVYTFSGFDLYTYEDEGNDYIAAVVFTDDTIATPEGVSLFANASDVFDTYGDDYTENLVSFTYEEGRSQLIFLIEEEEVTSIEYLGTVD